MRKPLFLALIGLFMAGLCVAWAAAPPPVAVDFGSNDNVVNLKPELTPYHSPGGPEADGSVWYMVAVTNNSGAARHPRSAGGPAAPHGAALLSPSHAARDPGGGEFGFRRGGRARQGLWRTRLARDHSARHPGGPGACASAMPRRRPRCRPGPNPRSPPTTASLPFSSPRWER